VGVSSISRGFPGCGGGEEHIVIATHTFGAARRRPERKSTALQYTYGADKRRHRQPLEPRRALAKSVVLSGREQYLPGRGGGEEHIVLATQIVGAARRRPGLKSTAVI